MRLLNYKAAKLPSKIKDRFHSSDRWLCNKGICFGRRFTVQFCTQIRHLRNEKATGAEIDSEKPRGDEPIKYVCMYVNAPYNCLWDGYRGRAGQLLVNIFPVPINSPKSLCEPDPGSLSFLKWRLWPPWRPIAGQLLANFFPVPINSSRSLCESYLDPVSLSFSKWPPWRHMKMIYRKEDQIPPKS